MKFGKIDQSDKIQFELPPTPAWTVNTLKTFQTETAPNIQIYIGCTGWSMKEWVGKIYPAGTKPADYLLHYGKQFNSIELNTTFYRIPDKKTIDNWKKNTPEDFKFCPKFPKFISQSGTLGVQDRRLTDFIQAVMTLEGKLGPCFLQLPPTFGIDRLDILLGLLKIIPPDFPVAIEFRHPSWFEQTTTLEDVAERLFKYRAGTVITDVAGRRDVLHHYLTNSTAFIRFVGNGLHSSDYRRIDDWVKRIKEWITMGVHAFYFFPHEPDNVLAPELSVYLTEQMRSQKVAAQFRGPNIQDSGNHTQLELF